MLFIKVIQCSCEDLLSGGFLSLLHSLLRINTAEIKAFANLTLGYDTIITFLLQNTEVRACKKQ